MRKIFSQKSAYTLIEIILVVMIITSILGYAAFTLNSSQRQGELNAITDELVQTLRKAQTLTVAGRQNTVSGVYFEADRYIFFQGEVYSPLGKQNEVFLLPDILTLDQINLNGGGAEIVFTRPYGQTTHNGSLRVYLNASEYQVISINVMGRVTVN